MLVDTPWEDKDVVAILIDGMSDFIHIKPGSYTVDQIELNPNSLATKKEFKDCIFALESGTGHGVFLFGTRLAAVKYLSGYEQTDERTLP
jgi:hypothetical protein